MELNYVTQAAWADKLKLSKRTDKVMHCFTCWLLYTLVSLSSVNISYVPHKFGMNVPQGQVASFELKG